MSRPTASIDIGSKGGYIGQIENSLPEFCVQSTQKEQDVVSRVKRDVR